MNTNIVIPTANLDRTTGRQTTDARIVVPERRIIRPVLVWPPRRAPSRAVVVTIRSSSD